ncbi:MAG: hypothetical protein BGO51_22690 [Rhodospirillales bacterium 69-11]|nr:anti-sigma factor [Rhodospirillales bacterium]OJW31327.1 MAG: hypothetical protein BGO51_22690 [Rhodospirillales bacterium 69-11]
MTAPRPSDAELHAFVDGQASAAQRAAVQSHLAADPEDAARVAAWQAQRDALRAAFAELADEDLPARLTLAAVLQERRRRPHVAWSAIAAAAVLAFGIGGAGGWMLRGRTEAPAGMRALAREAMANHAVYAADRRRPTELGADQRDDLARWVSNRMNHTVAPPDLSAEGFQFMGGRLAATAQGPAGMFMYQNAAGMRMTVFVQPDPNARSSGPMTITGPSLDSCVWSDRGMSTAVVAPMPADKLRALAEQVRRALES